MRIGKALFETENVLISRLSFVMEDIKYVDHVRIELETQVFRIRFMDYLSIHDHLSYSQISNYIQQRYVKIRSI